MVEMDLKEFKKRFPHLALELQGSSNRSLRTLVDGKIDPFLGYEPTVEDYIRRCETLEEAEQTIDWLVTHGKLCRDRAMKLKQRLRNEGLRSFGPKKEPGYYLRKGGYI